MGEWDRIRPTLPRRYNVNVGWRERSQFPLRDIISPGYRTMPYRLLLLAHPDGKQPLDFDDIVDFVSKPDAGSSDSVRISYIDSEMDRVDICSDSELEEALRQPGHLTLLVSSHSSTWNLHLPPFYHIMESMLNGMESIGSAVEEYAEAACDAVFSIYTFTAFMIRATS